MSPRLSRSVAPALLLVALVAGCQAPQPPADSALVSGEGADDAIFIDITFDQTTDTYLHPKTGLHFPPQIAGWSRADAAWVDEDGAYRLIYQRPDRESPIRVSLFHRGSLPALADKGDPLERRLWSQAAEAAFGPSVVAAPPPPAGRAPSAKVVSIPPEVLVRMLENKGDVALDHFTSRHGDERGQAIRVESSGKGAPGGTTWIVLQPRGDFVLEVSAGPGALSLSDLRAFLAAFDLRLTPAKD